MTGNLSNTVIIQEFEYKRDFFYIGIGDVMHLNVISRNLFLLTIYSRICFLLSIRRLQSTFYSSTTILNFILILETGPA